MHTIPRWPVAGCGTAPAAGGRRASINLQAEPAVATSHGLRGVRSGRLPKGNASRRWERARRSAWLLMQAGGVQVFSVSHPQNPLALAMGRFSIRGIP